VSGKVFGSVLITAEAMEVVSIDLDISTNWKFTWGDEFVVPVNVLVLSSL